MGFHEITNKREGKCMKKRGNLKVYKKTISLFLSLFMFTQVFAFNIPFLGKNVVSTA